MAQFQSIFTDDKINVVKKLKFVFGKAENIVEKAENAFVTSIFSFSHVMKSYLTRVRDKKIRNGNKSSYVIKLYQTTKYYSGPISKHIYRQQNKCG